MAEVRSQPDEGNAFRAIYTTVERQTREKVESLLDRIAHDELD